MFNRTIQLDVVKKNVRGQAAPKEDVEGDVSEYVAAAVVAAQTVAETVLKGVAVYMVLDTTRKIVVNRLTK